MRSESGTWYVVVGIADNAGRYSGRSLAVAAIHLAVGTCYGKGRSLTEALETAWAAAWRFRMEKQRRAWGAASGA